jgi:DNA-binding response OmpR family regulator
MSKTALIVDDSPTMRQMVAFTLTNAGFTVVEAVELGATSGGPGSAQ